MNYLTDTTLLERRQDLRDHVWSHGPEHFNMEHWYAVNGKHQYEGNASFARCGTTACLGGHGLLTLRQHGVMSDNALWDSQRAFDLPRDVFFMRWDTIRIGDESMLNVYLRHADLDDSEDWALGTNPHAEWSTILDYLDDLIKSEIEAT